MSTGMCILLETEHLRNTTPATVSRCGLIYLNKNETCDPKAIFNQWLRNLPPNLTEYQKEIETTTNFLMVEAIAVFKQDQAAGTLNWKRIDLHWLMQSFVRLLTTLIFDYYLEYEKSNAQSMGGGATAKVGGTTLQNVTLQNKWMDTKPDPNMTVFLESEGNNISWPASRGSSRPASKQRVATPDVRAKEIANAARQKRRLPNCNFIDNETRYENALKFTPVWLEAFVIFSMVWTFYPALSEKGRKLLDHKLQTKYNSARSDFGVYQREKKKKMQEKNREKTSLLGKAAGTPATAVKRKGAATALQPAPQAPAKGPKDAEAKTFDSFTTTWTDSSAEKPMLISAYPEGASFYDYYFTLDFSEWVRFDLAGALGDEASHFESFVPS
jgi:hypothetical protein